MFPSQLVGFKMHTERNEKVDHVDLDRSYLNQVLIGTADWREEALAEIDLMRRENLAEELEALKRRNRTPDIKARALQGLEKDPWRSTSTGPLREVILTANKDWFEDTDAQTFLGSREADFKFFAVHWLESHFEDDVIHAHVDHDERACHIHAIIMPRTTKISKRRGNQRLLQPSSHPLLKDYEKAQDDAGRFFSQIGLCRGEEGKRARMEAKELGLPAPDRRQHIPPSRWREEEWRRIGEAKIAIEAEKADLTTKTAKLRQDTTLIAEQFKVLIDAKKKAEVREERARQRELEADAVIAVAEAIEQGHIDFETLDKSGLPCIDPRASDLAARIVAGGRHSQGILRRFGSGFVRMKKKAMADVQKRLLRDFDLARTAIRDAFSLRKKAMIRLDETQRKQFQQEISDEDGSLISIRDEIQRRDKDQGGASRE